MSDDPYEILFFLGLDAEKWHVGFETKHEICDWILICKYFKKEYFSFEHYNYRQKVRLDTRPFVNDFIDYVHETQPNDIDTISEDFETKTTVLDLIETFHKHQEKEIIDQKLAVQKLYQEKFNGRVFLLYTKAKNINQSKEKFKKYVSVDENEFEEYLRRNDKEFIHEQIKEFILTVDSNLKEV